MIKIAIIGPESTGKSTLSEALATHFQTAWVPEYARAYLNQLERNYVEDDLLTIAKGQVAQELKYANTSLSLLFCDTTLAVIKVWGEHKFKRCHPWILQQLEKNSYHHFFLTDIDMPWEPDPQREHPHLRKHFFDVYKNYLEKNKLPFTLVSGSKNIRLKMAVQKVEELLTTAD